MEQSSFTHDRELKVNGGSNTDRTLAAGSGQFIWLRRTSLVWPDAGRSCDRTLGACVRSTPVRVQTWESVTGPWVSSIRSITVSIQERSDTFGQYWPDPDSVRSSLENCCADWTDWSVRSIRSKRPVIPQKLITVRFSGCLINRSSTRVWSHFCSFQQLRNTFVSAKKSKVLVRCLWFENPRVKPH